MQNMKIGVLGGSFNPAHDGHRYISLMALRLLGLDAVWWLVSPQNPLKSLTHMAEYEDRLTSARAIASHPRIIISDFERKLGQSHTVHTLTSLKQTYPGRKFVWLMGADNLIQFPSWHQWERIMKLVPIAVFNRPGYTYQALNGKTARKYNRYRLKTESGGHSLLSLVDKKPPCWAYVAQTTHKLSSTHIRNFHDNAGNACS